MVNIVSFNGGRGAKNLIPALLNKEGINLTSIVNAYDDGKSTGELRNFFKMLGPSDIRKVQQAMVPQDLPDYEGILKLYDFRYAVGKTGDEVTNRLKAFAENKTDKLEGIGFEDKTIEHSMRVCINTLLNGIRLVEQAEGKQLNFSDCSIMNLIYAGAYLYFGGDFEEATIFIDKLFKLDGTVLPTNNEDKKLVAIREDGTILYSEAEIVELRSNSRIKKIYLLDQYPARDKLSKMPISEVEAYFEIMNRQVGITPRVERSIRDADVIIYSPGTQHSSLYPSYMTKGITDAIVANKEALKLFITNIGEDYETPRYTAQDFINGAIRYFKMGSQYNVAIKDIINYALVNNLFSGNLENYVKFDIDELNKIGCDIIVDAFEDENDPGKHNGSKIADFALEYFFKLNSLKDHHYLKAK